MATKRTFQSISEEKVEDADKQQYFASLGRHGVLGWDEVLESKRILIISEAGVGKTYECRAECLKLWEAGEPAFYLELATLAKSNVRSMLSLEEEERMDAWLASQSDIATFFIDSIDELKLSLGSFENALKRFRKDISGQLSRIRVVVTTRPIPFDGQLIRRLLPIPEQSEIKADGDTFARVALHGSATEKKDGAREAPPDWRTVALMPLSDPQIADFAKEQGVNDPLALIEDLTKRNAQEFARRPQDLIELCSDWRRFRRIRNHRDQVASNILIKLKPREERNELTDLSIDRAREGASRLALAMMVTRRLTIRHNAESDAGNDDTALDPTKILSDWSSNERKTLLERPLFGFASYGRVRFHHRSVAEYLAAERILALRTDGMSTRSLKRLIFANTKGRTIVRPSKRPIAAWLALNDAVIFETLRDHEPAILFTEGDPESLTLSQKSQALRSYVKRHGIGSWRGLSVPHIQIHRFASPELGEHIKNLWREGIENPEVRSILLSLIENGRIESCAEIAYSTALDQNIDRWERYSAVEALMGIKDSRLRDIGSSIATDPQLWPDHISKSLIILLFPEYLSIQELCKILARIGKKNDLLDIFETQLPRLISESNLSPSDLDSLRDEFVKLIRKGLRWQEGWPHLTSDNRHLSKTLAVLCIKALKIAITDAWLQAASLALRLPERHSDNEKEFSLLLKLLANLPAKENERLFWINDKIIRSVHTLTDPWEHFAQVAIQGPVHLQATRDSGWIRRKLANKSSSLPRRELLLEAAIRLPSTKEERSRNALGLMPLVADQPQLLKTLNEKIKQSKQDRQLKRLEKEELKNEERRRKQKEKAHASWVKFWHEVAEHPDRAFSSKHSGGTAWDLWRAMSRADGDNRASGWNRRFIESNFGKETADRLRLTLMAQWRRDKPTLTSERPDEEKNTFLVRWQLGVAAIYSEAEDPDWATKLSPTQAELAVRFATIELNRLPPWLDSLAKNHPQAITTILGNELKLELQNPAADQWHSSLLQHIGHSSAEVVNLFMPVLQGWLDFRLNSAKSFSERRGEAQKLSQVLGILIKHGNIKIRSHLCKIAKNQLTPNLSDSFTFIWLHTLIQLDPNSGIDALTRWLSSQKPARTGPAVSCIGRLWADRHDGISLSDSKFTPKILLRLLRIVYQHVRPEDDEKHKGIHSMGDRDYAERARSTLIDAVLKAKGEEGLAAKMEMAADPLCAYFKDRIIAVAEEVWAEEIDSVAFEDSQAIALDKTGEASSSSNESMFSIMIDRLQELDDQLLRDDSPREAWAAIKSERVMRRELARDLNHFSHGLYKVDQEAVTADEKETDIRLLSTTSLYQAVIELKIADGRSAADLRDTISAQLVKKYMASDTSRSGCLLFTVSENRTWNHPENGSTLEFEDLVSLLRKEATSIEEKTGGTVRLHIHALDLRPRLPVEAKVRKTARTNKKAGKKKPKEKAD